MVLHIGSLLRDPRAIASSVHLTSCDTSASLVPVYCRVEVVDEREVDINPNGLLVGGPVHASRDARYPASMQIGVLVE